MSSILSREEALFAAAIAQPTAQRGAYLVQVCGDDTALRERLATLISAHEKNESLLDCPVAPRLARFAEEKTGELIGRYKLLQKIGEGGCGVVWMAEQEEPVRRRVALKVIKLGMDTKAVVARFDAERQALALMDHPNIAKVYDAGSTATGRPFFVMELVRGIPITKYCDENQLTPKERLELFIKLCQAVQHAHQKGIIHRDLKPSNILVTLNDGAPTPKIIDFGIAKATQGRLTDATIVTTFDQFIGTPVYMSPEQAEMSSLDIDTRTDIYSLGILLYELLTGRPPFDPKAFARAGVEEIRHHIHDDELPRPSTRWRTLAEAERSTLARQRRTAPGQLSVILRGDLDWIVMRCIEKDRTRRYDTANGIVADIQRYMRHEPVVARPPSTTYLLKKLVRRHRVGVAAGVSIVGALLMGAIVSTLLAFRATRAEQEQIALRLTAQKAQAKEGVLRRSEAELRRQAEAQVQLAGRHIYAANMIFAQQALKVGNVERARELLERYRPSSGQFDLRGWEWRYVWQESRADIGDVLDVCPNVVLSLASSNDGTWLAAGSYWWTGETGGRVRVWNLRRRESFRMTIGDSSTRVVFSPSAPLLAISGCTRRVDASGPGMRAIERSWIELWNVTTRRMERRLELPPEPCFGLAFSHDGNVLVAATFGDSLDSPPRPTVMRWRVRDGHELGSFQAPPTLAMWDPADQFAISSDLASAAYPTESGNAFRVIDLNTGEVRWHGTPGTPVALAFSHDASLLASGSGWAGSTITLWDVDSGAEVGRFDAGEPFVSRLAFRPHDNVLVGSTGRTIRLWDVPGRRLLRTLGNHRSRIFELELLQDGAQLASVDLGGEVRLWRTDAPPPPRVQSAAIGKVEGWCFARDGGSVFTCSVDGSLAEWAIPGFQAKRKIAFEAPRSFRDLAGRTRLYGAVFAPDRPLIAIGSRDGFVWVFDFEQRSLLTEITIGSTIQWPAAFLAGGNRLLIFDGSRSPPVYHEWDLTGGREAATWTCPERHRPSALALTPDERRALVLAQRGGLGFIRDIGTGTSTPVRRAVAGSSPAFSADGRLFASIAQFDAKLFNVPSFEELGTLFRSDSALFSVAFSPDGSRLATGSRDGTAVWLWDVESQQPLLVLSDSSKNNFITTAFSPDGTVIGSSDHTGRLVLWRPPSWAEIEAAEKAAARPRGDEGARLTPTDGLPAR